MGMTAAPTASELAADPTLCPKCASKRTAVIVKGYLSKRACLDCWHAWDLGYPWPSRSAD